jgi:hypothetical protein
VGEWKPRAVLVDIDGTVADMGKGQPGRRGPFDWDRVHEDDPHEPILELVRALLPFYFVLFVSGRDEVCREQTEAWLQAHRVLDPGMGHRLHMRTHKDNRGDELVKREIYEKKIAPHFDVAWVLDDRNKVVAMWRSLGLTVLQVADGDF